jgi:ribonuclease E
MSRQRLRPALNEGASIPCPRCGGSGHIRDTESSALQILRIIQEESLKDSTASVLCQVPVDVASFLLNEKRSEIAKIELKQRINVLLVPNKTLETPNYRLERLKHDDPRLDNIEASYKLAEEIEDPTTVTRRSQEKHNKQEPIIKGVLPDAPAPAAQPRPQAPPVAAPRAAPRPETPSSARTPAAAEKGMFSWLKSLFSGTETPAVAPAVKEVPTSERGEGRRDARPDGRPDGRSERPERGERSERGGRDGRRGGRGRGDGRPENRVEGSAEGRSENRNDGRTGERRERNPEGRVEGGRPDRQERPVSENRQEGRNDEQPRNDGREGRERGDRNRRERGDRIPRDAVEQDLALANQAAMAAAAGGEATGQRQDRPAQRAAQEMGRDGERQQDGRGEGRSDGRRERGGERNGRRNDQRNDRTDGSTPPVASTRTDSFDAAHPAVVAVLDEAGNPVVPASSRDLQGRTEGQEESPDRQPRERRSRDRYGRDRRERGERIETPADGSGTAANSEALESNPAKTPQERSPSATESIATATAAPPAYATPLPAAAPAPAPTQAATSISTVIALPKVQSYDLPLQDLAQVAQGSGLQWINSDATKIAEAKAAMAAEVKPVQVPRLRAPRVVSDEAPLVLVETKRDLSTMPLPFEKLAD